MKWCPKFPCELNVIEGLWCSQKLFVRRNTDQTYNTMLTLIVKSRENFREREIYLKLLRRFWWCLKAYDEGRSYTDVMKMFCSTKCEGTVTTHTRISTSNIPWVLTVSSWNWFSHLLFVPSYSLHLKCNKVYGNRTNTIETKDPWIQSQRQIQSRNPEDICLSCSCTISRKPLDLLWRILGLSSSNFAYVQTYSAFSNRSFEQNSQK